MITAILVRKIESLSQVEFEFEQSVNGVLSWFKIPVDRVWANDFQVGGIYSFAIAQIEQKKI